MPLTALPQSLSECILTAHDNSNIGHVAPDPPHNDIVHGASHRLGVFSVHGSSRSRRLEGSGSGRSRKLFGSMRGGLLRVASHGGVGGSSAGAAPEAQSYTGERIIRAGTSARTAPVHDAAVAVANNASVTHKENSLTRDNSDGGGGYQPPSPAVGSTAHSAAVVPSPLRSMLSEDTLPLSARRRETQLRSHALSGDLPMSTPRASMASSGDALDAAHLPVRMLYARPHNMSAPSGVMHCVSTLEPLTEMSADERKQLRESAGANAIMAQLGVGFPSTELQSDLSASAGTNEAANARAPNSFSSGTPLHKPPTIDEHGLIEIVQTQQPPGAPVGDHSNGAIAADMRAAHKRRHYNKQFSAPSVLPSHVHSAAQSASLGQVAVQTAAESCYMPPAPAKEGSTTQGALHVVSASDAAGAADGRNSSSSGSASASTKLVACTSQVQADGSAPPSARLVHSGYVLDQHGHLLQAQENVAGPVGEGHEDSGSEDMPDCWLAPSAGANLMPGKNNDTGSLSNAQPFRQQAEAQTSGVPAARSAATPAAQVAAEVQSAMARRLEASEAANGAAEADAQEDLLPDAEGQPAPHLSLSDVRSPLLCESCI